MIKKDKYIRRSVIPDISVKILKLCLDESENDFLFSCTRRPSGNFEYLNDIVLREVITEKICNKRDFVPITLRKKHLYEKIKNEQSCTENKLVYLNNMTCVPITMRKHILYSQVQAG